MSNTTSKKDDRPAFGVDWLNEPRQSPPQEYIDAFAIWCEIDEVERAIAELVAERAQLLSRLDGTGIAPAKELADGTVQFP